MDASEATTAFVYAKMVINSHVNLLNVSFNASAFNYIRTCTARHHH